MKVIQTNLKKVLAITLLSMVSCITSAKGCPSFTPMQDALIHQAYYTGLPKDMGYTLAAIVWKESFVGRYVVRVNEKDSGGGSYGVTMIQLETAMWLEGIDSIWEGKAVLVPKLISNDAVALSFALQKLLAAKMTLGTGWTWKALWKAYNGSGSKAEKYSKDIAVKVKTLRSCFNF